MSETQLSIGSGGIRLTVRRLPLASSELPRLISRVEERKLVIKGHKSGVFRDEK